MLNNIDKMKELLLYQEIESVTPLNLRMVPLSNCMRKTMTDVLVPTVAG